MPSSRAVHRFALRLAFVVAGLPGCTPPFPPDTPGVLLYDDVEPQVAEAVKVASEAASGEKAPLADDLPSKPPPSVAPRPSRLGRITVVARDASTGKPLTEVVVSLRRKERPGELAIVTDETGTFSFPDQAPDEYTLTFEADQYRPARRSKIVLAAGAKLRVEARLVYDPRCPDACL